jgi:RND superfamily putative drug exporter
MSIICHQDQCGDAHMERGDGVFEALGRLTARPRLVLGVTLLIVIGLAVAGRGVGKDLASGGAEDPGSQSYQAEQLLNSHFPASQTNLVLLVRTPDGQTVSSPAVVAEGKSLASRLSRQPSVDGVHSYWQTGSASMRSADGRYALIDAHITGGDTEVNRAYATIESGFGGRQGDVTVQFGGSAAVNQAIRGQITKDLGRAELIALPLTLAILVLVFGSLIAALLPLAIGVIAILGTDAALRVISIFTSVSVFSQNLTTALGLGLAIDYSLLLVRRFREEQRDGKQVRDAVRAAVRSAGRTIVFSALTVAAALSSMLVFPMFILRSFAYAGISVVLFAAVTAVIVVPAALVTLGDRVNALDVRRLFRRPRSRIRTQRPERAGRGWRWLTGLVMRFAPVFAIFVTGGLVLLLLPFLHVNFGVADYRQLPPGAGPRQVQQILQDDFSANPTGVVTVLADGASRSGLASYAARVSALPDAAMVAGVTGVYQHGHLARPPTARDAARISGRWTYLSVSPASPDISTRSQDLVNAIRMLTPGFPTQVSGDAASLVDTKRAISASLPLAAGIIAAATLLLIFLFTGSLLVPLLSVVLSALSLTAMFGAVVWTFQYGHGASLLAFTSTGFIDVTMPVLMFCVAFGLSMDYSVFLISRIKERFDQTHDNRAAVIFGVERTGGIITAAALILAVVLVAIGSSRITNIKMLGLGIALAVLVDSMIVRCLLVPAVMSLIGNATWWAPGPLRRFQARFGLHEAGQAAAIAAPPQTPAAKPVPAPGSGPSRTEAGRSGRDGRS